MASNLELARLMRGKVPEWDSTYIEEHIPANLLSKMMDGNWTDEDGFHWGFSYTFASKLKKTNENVVVVATKYHGQGIHELKVVKPDKSIQQIWDGDLIY
jgi:hypothetical protein